MITLRPSPSPSGGTRRRSTTVAVLVVVALLLAACSGGDDGGDESGSSSPTSAAGESTSASTATPADVPDLGRVVALGEEFLLADLLALGIEPVASTATVADVGFQGLDDYDTSEIEALPSDQRDIERLAALQPDTIITTSFFVDELGEETLTAIADLIEIPVDLRPEEQVAALGEELALEDAAAALVDEWETQEAATAEALADVTCEVSVATVYPGPSVAAWIAAPNPVPGILTDAGCTLVPGADGNTADVAGRLRLSEEQLGQLSAPVMVLLQSDTVEGESASLAAMDDDPLWARLPAVESGDVIELDRLGYPGIEGQARLAADLTEALTAGGGSGG